MISGIFVVAFISGIQLALLAIAFAAGVAVVAAVVVIVAWLACLISARYFGRYC